MIIGIGLSDVHFGGFASAWICGIGSKNNKINIRQLISKLKRINAIYMELSSAYPI